MSPQRFSIVFLTFLLLHFFCGKKISGQTNEKPEYVFYDTRVSHADSLIKQKDYAAALKAYQKVTVSYKSEEFYEGVVYATERAAYCYRRLRKDSLSAIYFQKAIELAKSKLEPNHMLLSKAYLNNGIRMHFKNSSLIATHLLDSAMWYYQKGKLQSTTIHTDIIRFKFYTQYYSMVNSDSLIKYAYEKMKLYDTKKHNSDLRIYDISDFGRAFYRTGDFRKSVSYSLVAVNKSRLNLGKVDPYHYADALFTLARSFRSLQDYNSTLDITAELLEFTKKNLPEHTDLLAYMNLKAITLTDLGRYEEARSIYLEILDSKRITKVNNDFFLDVIMNLGVNYGHDGIFNKSLFHLHRSLDLQKQAFNKSDFGLYSRYYNLGLIYSKKLEFKMAYQYYDSAILTLIPTNNRYKISQKKENNISIDILKTIKSKALNMKRYNDHLPNDNNTLLDSVLEITNKVHRHLLINWRQTDFDNTKLSLESTFKDLFSAAIDASYKTKSIYLALNNMTRAKSLLFLEQRAYLKLFNEKNAPSNDSFVITRVVIDSLDNLLNQQISIDPLGDSVMILNSEKMKWNTRLADIRKTIEENYPEAENDFLNKEVSIQSLREDHQLTNKKALVEYFVGDTVIFVIGLSGKKESFHRIKKDKALDEALSNFLGEVNTAPNMSELGAHLSRFGQSSSKIYQALLKPVLDDLGDISELIIVPDEILSRVPFELLISSWSGKEKSFKSLNYLMNNTKVSHLLSSKISFNEQAKSQGKGLLGFGYVGDSIVDERAAMGGLPGALKEINFLKSNFQGDYYMGKSGTKRQFLKKASEYDIIHLALHGKSDSVNRYNSVLVFNGDRDYYMTSTDLYRTRLQSKLAVLSACESGIGKISEGEGSFSIARGFAIAGVPSIVTTLWRVNDDAGAAIMQQFYLNLQAGDKKDDALRKAKLTYLEESDNLTASPYFWGSYILIGDTSTIELPTRNSLPWYWVAITILFLSAMGFGLRRLSRKPFDQAP